MIEGAIGAGVGALAGWGLQGGDNLADKAKAAVTGGVIGGAGGVALGHGIRHLATNHAANKVYKDPEYEGFTSKHKQHTLVGSSENHNRMSENHEQIDHLNKRLTYDESMSDDKKSNLKNKIDELKEHNEAIKKQMAEHSDNIRKTKEKDLKSKIFGVG